MLLIVSLRTLVRSDVAKCKDTGDFIGLELALIVSFTKLMIM